jgi:uncharacterized membrane protein
MTDSTGASLVTLATVIAGFLYQFITQARQRRWDLEDRRMARESTKQTAATLAETVVTTNLGLHAALAENTAKTQEAINAADAAYTEANTVNQKIEKLGIQASQDRHG